MKKITLSLACLLMAAVAFAQLKPGMMVFGRFKDGDVQYVAEILTASGDNFTCRFVHSNSVYTMKQGEAEMNGTMSAMQRTANVVSSRGGKFAAGSKFLFNAFVALPGECNYGTGAGYWDNFVIATFADGKRFLGVANAEGDKTTITFLHSAAVYEFSKSGVVLSSTGGYIKGSKATIKCAEEFKQ
jgi:hypothetical protein